MLLLQLLAVAQAQAPGSTFVLPYETPKGGEYRWDPAEEDKNLAGSVSPVLGSNPSEIDWTDIAYDDDDDMAPDNLKAPSSAHAPKAAAAVAKGRPKGNAAEGKEGEQSSNTGSGGGGKGSGGGLDGRIITVCIGMGLTLGVVHVACCGCKQRRDAVTRDIQEMPVVASL